MATLRNKRNNSLPSLNMNKFFVSKRASMFETFEETPRERRERSPCGLLEISERKMEARKEKERKEAMVSRKKRQADPYAEESTEMEEEDHLGIESKFCGHANRSVNLNLVRKFFKQINPIGECTSCQRAKDTLSYNNTLNIEGSAEKTDTVIWLCCFCGHQGCDRNSRDKHAYTHYKTPRSDPHCIVLNVQAWTVWCYECDSEVVLKSSKKLHEVVNFIKRQSEMAPRRTINNLLQPTRLHTTNLTTQFSGSDSRLHLSSQSYEDTSKATKNNKNLQASVLAALPKVKGLVNLGNTCFFNSVLQNLSQTHYLTQILDIHAQKGQKITLPGRQKWPAHDDEKSSKVDRKNYRHMNGESRDSSESEQETEDNIELKPLDLYLSEGGTLTTSFAVLLKELHCVGKSNIVNPGHLFGLICKKSTQFQGFQQQDAHELLRCLLDAIRNEETIRIKKSILRSFGYSEKTDPNSVPSRLKKVIKGYGKQAAHTLVEQIFGGHLISTVFCEECHVSSQVFEPFMDLSLPINEEKGKPKKSNSFEDDGIFDCFGRSSNLGSHNPASKYQQKKQRKIDKKKKRRKKNSKNQELNLPCIKVNDEKDDLERAKEDKRNRRLTEKRRPEDMEEYRLKEEAERNAISERLRMLEEKKRKKGESNKFRMLMQARSNSKKDNGEEIEGGESGEEEEQEYDPDEEDDDDSFGIERKSLRHLDNNLFSKLKSSSVDELEDDEEEEEEDEDEEEEDDEDETEGNETSSDGSSTQNNKNYRVSRENSDADVEDNTDSEYIRGSFQQNTRQPSIVVDESQSDQFNSEPLEINNRYLMTSNSYDQLNYNSCSDTSERYFTAAGGDTMDELDHGYGGDNLSLRSNHTSSTLTMSSGKGDSISMSSGDMYAGHYDDKRLIVDQGHMDEMCLKVSEIKIRRKSSSKENLLESQSKHGHKRGSTETLHTFNSDKIEDDEPTFKKNQTIKKLKQEWISRSLTTLSPRYQSDREECSVMSCLANFTSPELLTGNNKISCENCSKLRSNMNSECDRETIKSNASKQLLVLSPPAVLTLHLKRFHHVGFNLAKVNRYVQFPIVLDLAPFTSSISLGLGNMTRGQSQVIYMLYGVVEHSGRLNSGHYVAYVRSRPLDMLRTSKQFLNMKPSSQFDVNQLVCEMADKVEAEGGAINKTLKPSPSSRSSIKVEDIEEEVKSGRWYHVSDSYVGEVNFEKVCKAQAYLLFYERIL